LKLALLRNALFNVEELFLARCEVDPMKTNTHKLLVILLFFVTQRILQAQSTGQEGNAVASISQPKASSLEEELKQMSSALAETQQQLQRSLQQVQMLQSRLGEIERQISPGQPGVSTSSSLDTVSSLKAEVADIKEQQEILQSQVKLHEQTKVESTSKYPVRVSGLILFNAFANTNVVNMIDIPSLTYQLPPGTSSQSAGAGFRQTILGIEGVGPKLWGGQSSADVSLDFFGGLAYSNYASSAGIVRMRTASLNLDWANDRVQAGFVEPFISPLSPTSYATVAEPALAGAGNLWTWAPQVLLEHRLPLNDGRHLGFEFGLRDPPAAGFSTSEYLRTPSPGERSMQPAYEGHIAYKDSKEEHLDLGIGGYYSRQSYPGNLREDSWAFTMDWRVPLPARLEISGEGYRGRSIGGLGGGVYKDTLTGTDPITGAPVTRGLNAIGGWTQLKKRFSQTIEANAAIGQDTGLAGDFHSLILPPNTSPTQLRARNRMLMSNLIFKPKTYLILSPEYRRVWAWQITGPATTVNIFTLSAGYQF
jgi:hypothetical protein